MGAKASTSNGGDASPRTRTFSTSSSSEVVAATGGSGPPQGFSFLRTIPSSQVATNDRQRARSLSSVPDSHHSSHEAIGIPNTNATNAYEISESPETESSSSPEDHILVDTTGTLPVTGRVFTAHSLPSHIWSLNGEYILSAANITVTIFLKYLRVDQPPCMLLK